MATNIEQRSNGIVVFLSREMTWKRFSSSIITNWMHYVLCTVCVCVLWIFDESTENNVDWLTSAREATFRVPIHAEMT